MAGYMRVPDTEPEEPDMVTLSDRAYRVIHRARAYCHRHMTDGFLPEEILRGFVGESAKVLRELTGGSHPKLTAKEGGYQVTNYLRYNDSRESILARREADSQRKSRRHPTGLPTATASDSASSRGQEQIPERPRDLLFEAIAEAAGIDWHRLTPAARGQLNRATGDIRAAEGTPDDVPGCAHVYRRKFPDAALTPSALAKHWPSLGRPKDPAPKGPPVPVGDVEPTEPPWVTEGLSFAEWSKRVREEATG